MPAYGGPVETYELITLAATLQDTGDLEAATKTITATAEPAADDYSAALTLPVPSDARLALTRLGTRLAVTLDSLNAGATHCYVRVYVDTINANNLLYDLDLAAPAATLNVQQLLVGTKDTIFNLLKGGSAHTFKVRMWVDQGNAVISLVNLWEAVGAVGAASALSCMTLTHVGQFQVSIGFSRVGTGTMTLKASPTASAFYGPSLTTAITSIILFSPGTTTFPITGTVATDLNYLTAVQLVLRSLT